MINLREILSGDIQRMSSVNRYSSFPVIRHENVAEHSWWVAFIAYLIAIDLMERRPVLIDIESLLARALMHDVSECASGDIIRSYKHTNMKVRDAMALADSLNMDKLVLGKEFDLVGADLIENWASAKSEGTIGDIIKFADMVTVVMYCRQEAALGNAALGDTVLKELYETWMHSFHFHTHLGPYMEQLFPGRRYSDPLVINRPAAVPIMRDHSEGPVVGQDWAEVGSEGTP